MTALTIYALFAILGYISGFVLLSYFEKKLVDKAHASVMRAKEYKRQANKIYEQTAKEIIEKYSNLGYISGVMLSPYFEKEYAELVEKYKKLM